MPSQSYWSSLTDQRIARRRLLKGASALSLGAATLAMIGCGGDDDDDGNGNGGSGSGGEPQRGGRLGRAWPVVVANNNPFTTSAQGAIYGAHVYDRLLTGRTDDR